ncbi:DUF397 domain-containing protein [Streptomyces sp. NPDC048290]|uniref:DUF397 domain-containing protein n=1 Tax=Streptomyces sp. NPDC048290 TaxID=3155811 RepID=UPI00341542CA
MDESPQPTTTRWVKSTYSGNGGDTCVEWAPDTATASGLVPIRDSKTPTGPSLLIPEPAWSAFIGHLRDLSP